MGVAAGDRIGAYLILDKLGEGGMGEVYRARDTRLNRDVALKVLPEIFARDPGRLARFTREAQLLASLNHPNIGAIYRIEQKALVMELVDGEDLAAIVRRGPLPLADVLPIVKQIADALEAAHEQGIVHRDLKPGNIKVKADGTVKVLDFGLAKALGPDVGSAPDLMNSPTLTAPATQLGMIIGTAAYMAPEQARGKAVDRRADIWAFGAVLYEMLTGLRTFEGDDVSTTLASVLKDEPRWNALPADLPSPLTRLLRRCLDKDPRRRLSAIGDARLELDEHEPVAAASPVTAPASRPSMLSRLWPAAAGIVVTAVAAALLWPSSQPPTGQRVQRLSILPPPGEQVYPDSTGIAVSPDGTMVAFIVGSVARSENEVWVRPVGSMSARRLEGTESAGLVFWSPDSTRIGFFTNSKLKIISASGGRAETVADAPSGRGAVWTRSNVIIFAPDAGGPLFRVSPNGGTPVAVTALDTAKKEYGHRFPTLLPDGEHFLYAALPGKNGKFDIFAGSLADKSRKFVASLEAAPVFAEPGWLLYARQGVLTALPFDAAALQVTGDPVILGDEPSNILDPATSWTAGWSVSVSEKGSLGYYSAPSLNTVATWYDATGTPTGTLNLPPAHYESIAISPDGTRGVVVRSTSPSESSLWLVDLARGGATPLSSGRGRNDAPVWSPDGTRVVWASDRDGIQNLFVKTANDPAPEQQLFGSNVLFKNPVDWSRDGQWIVMTQLDQDTSQNVWLVDASGTKPASPIVRGPLRDNAGPISPDGRWIAFSSEDSGRFEVYVQSFPTPGRRVQVSENGAVLAWWTRDGRRMVLLGSDLRTLSRVNLQPGDTLGVGTSTRFARLPADIVSVDAMPDRERFIAIAPERTGTGSVTIVQNWRAALPESR
jgi:serine/threonine protein kinase/Tol biopolymer transport system component